MMLLALFYCFIGLVLIFKASCGWCYSKVCLLGKTAVVTGGNSGIGYQTALSLASRGCRVIIADVADSSNARDTIVRETGNPNILSKRLDLQSFKSVIALAQDIIDTEPELHILINNAGIGGFSSRYTTDGLQKIMQVNYYGHFLLTHLLLDLLKKSAPSRIIFTSSIAAFLTRLKLEDMNPSVDKPLLADVYANSKLCITIAANEFAKRLKGTGVTANSLHPGGVRSKLFFSFVEFNSVLIFLARYLAFIFFKNCEQGAQTLIYLACAKELEHVTGEFFVDCRKFIQPLQVYHKEFCKEVWNLSMKLTGLDPSRNI